MPVELQRTLQTMFDWVDAHVFWGRRFAGREWTANDFDWDCPYPSLMPGQGNTDMYFERENDVGIETSWNKTLWELYHRRLSNNLGDDFAWILITSCRGSINRETRKTQKHASSGVSKRPNT